MAKRLPSTVDIQLNILAAAVIAASANGIGLDLGVNFAPDAGGQPVQGIVNITAIKTSATNETYTFTLQDSPDNATWTNRSPATVATAVGGLVVSGFIEQRYVRLSVVLAGTAPTITVLDCYLNPLVLG